VVLRCAVRGRVARPGGGETVGVEFLPEQWPAIGTLTQLLFNAGVGLDVVGEPAPVGAVA
jgi:hypothetical protein